MVDLSVVAGDLHTSVAALKRKSLKGGFPPVMQAVRGGPWLVRKDRLDEWMEQQWMRPIKPGGNPRLRDPRKPLA